MSFAESLTARQWIFSKEDYDAHRRRACITDGALNPNDPEEQAMRVTMEEQTQLLKFFVSSSFSAMCENLEKDMPARVKATALGYFKRFYVHNSVNNPQNAPLPLLLASVFVACKTEEYRTISFGHVMAKLGHEKNLQAEHLRTTEITLLNGIKFHLNIYLPFRPVTGLVADFRHYCTQVMNMPLPPTFGLASTQLIHNLLYALLEATDVDMLFPPTIIAMAGISRWLKLNEPQLADAFGHYAQALLQQDASAIQAVAEVESILADLQIDPSTGRAVLPTDIAAIKTTNKKLNGYKAWSNAQLLAESAGAPAYQPVDPPLSQQPTLEAATSHMNSD